MYRPRKQNPGTGFASKSVPGFYFFRPCPHTSGPTCRRAPSLSLSIPIPIPRPRPRPQPHCQPKEGVRKLQITPEAWKSYSCFAINLTN